MRYCNTCARTTEAHYCNNCGNKTVEITDVAPDAGSAPAMDADAADAEILDAETIDTEAADIQTVDAEIVDTEIFDAVDSDDAFEPVEIIESKAVEIVEEAPDEEESYSTADDEWNYETDEEFERRKAKNKNLANLTMKLAIFLVIIFVLPAKIGMLVLIFIVLGSFLQKMRKRRGR